ncbi:MAG: type II secretion system minor pseudopilin GspK [Betaproteobacteria bacterium]
MKRREQGAAIIMAMLVMTLAVLLVSGAFLRQSVMAREVENAAAAAQSRALLAGAIDWIRVILVEDGDNSSADHAGEPWAVPLERTRLDGGDGESAWLSGRVEDAQARFNLRNLSNAGGLIASEVAVLGRLLGYAGVDDVSGEQLAARIDAALTATRSDGTVLVPGRVEDLRLPEESARAALEKLRPFVVILPQRTPININTASAEVLAARLPALSLADARRLVASRDVAWFRDASDFASRLPGVQPGNGGGQLATATRFFLLRGKVEFRRARTEAQVLLRREGRRVDTLWVREAAT